MGLIARLSQYHKQHPLSFRLVFFIILCSTFFALLATALQLYFDYKRDLKDIRFNLKFIDHSYVPSISTSLYYLDDVQLRLQLKAIMKLQDIEYVHIKDVEFDMFEGDPNATHDIAKKFPLRFNKPSGEIISLGSLTAAASLNDVYARLWDKVLVILGSNTLKTFFTSAFILLIVQFLITRHLTKMASFARHLSLNQLDSPLDLDRKGTRSSEPDELDQVIMALNDMQTRLKIDVEKRMRVEEALRQSEMYVRLLLDSTAEAIYGLDMEGNCTLANPACVRFLGYNSTDDLIGKNMHELIHYSHSDGSPYQKVECQILKAPHKRESCHVDNEVLWRSDGTSFPAEYWSYPVYQDKKIVGAVVTFFNITERKSLEAQLQQAQKMESIGTLAGGIAHDFNNILGIILGNTELAIDDVQEWNPARQNLTEIRTACLRARDIVRQILAFSRQTKQEKKSIRISRIAEDSIQLLRSSIPTTIDIRLNILSKEDIVNADPTQINQIILNLCTNAAHAMRKRGGILEVNLEDIELDEEGATEYQSLTSGRYIKMTIRDTGHGMEPATIEKIFDPYFTTKEVGEGSGMGLAVVHGIVKNHGGDISVNSELGKGTTFEILFPSIDDKIESSFEDPAQLAVGDERILLVDDEKAMVAAFQPMLERLGYQVTAKTNGVEALKVFRAMPGDYDVVITDMTMPVMTGVDLAKGLMQIRSNIPIILCTGFSDMIDKHKAEEIGIRAFVMKPMVISEIAKTIRQVLDQGKVK